MFLMDKASLLVGFIEADDISFPPIPVRVLSLYLW